MNIYDDLYYQAKLNQAKLNLLQQTADLCCDVFGLPKIPVKLNKRLKRYYGLYYHYSRIELSIYGLGIDTLLHELAHHLQTIKHGRRKKGSKIHGKTFKYYLRQIKNWYYKGGE
jgi:hypothetical protein